MTGAIERDRDGSLFRSLRAAAWRAVRPDGTIFSSTAESLACAALGLHALWLDVDAADDPARLRELAASTLEEMSCPAPGGGEVPLDVLFLGPLGLDGARGAEGPSAGYPCLAAHAAALPQGTAERRDCDSVLNCYRVAAASVEIAEFSSIAWYAASRLRAAAESRAQEGRI